MGHTRKVMQKNRIKQCITLFSASLLLWLLWGFWSFGKEISYFLTAFICIVTLSLCVWFFRQQKSTPYLKNALTNLLPPDNYQGAVIIVCGQSQMLFHENQTYRETAKGWYIRAASPIDLINITQHIVDIAPLQLRRLSLLYALLPEQQLQLEEVTQETLNWRRAIHESNKKTGKTLPFWVTLYLNSPVNYLNSHFDDITPWIIYLNDQPELLVISDNLATQSISTWLSQNREQTENQLTMALWLDQLLAWLKSEFIPLLTVAQSGTPSLIPVAWAMQFTTVPTISNNSWAQFIHHKTTLFPTIIKTSNNNDELPLPDIVIDKLTYDVNLLKIETTFGVIGMICGLFLIGALSGSYHHNKQLIYDNSNDINHFKSISDENLEPKKVAYQQLLSDATFLSHWQREGIPARYSLALYQGNNILPYLHALLSSWALPQPPAPIIVQEVPEMVTLDSLALFASGQYKLKNEATKVLVDALINIKAKPGWLIVISGYTDNTGNPDLNQKLSLKRAEAVRDWMIKTSDIAPSCFAVQGYGQHQPIADNSTLDGRARNRRVEIRLIPQADACQVLADDLTPLKDSGN
ncbi:OmpA family protein [Proteus sp. G2661]|nr:OmpA family protein [Proteus sp. G2670]NBM33193.1 OmpA family protein [Proteus sp. G2664]NBM68951.1 OmpA family protein [Proteus sp. G2663]NBM85591.1 OmpA family protein [Proteus sp. G2661]